MAVHLIRLVILYVFLLCGMRLMGRRQIGELQTSELVVTILLSEIAVIPVENNDIPILNSIVAIFALSALEILFSAVTLKSDKFRKLSQGNPIFVVRDGKLDQNALKKMRITLDDFLEGLREKDVFNIKDVQYAIVESNGKLSVQLKPESRTITTGQMQLITTDNGLVWPIVYDGEIQHNNLSICEMNEDKLNKLLQKCGIPLSEILLLTADKNAIISCIRKEKS